MLHPSCNFYFFKAFLFLLTLFERQLEFQHDSILFSSALQFELLVRKTDKFAHKNKICTIFWRKVIYCCSYLERYIKLRTWRTGPDASTQSFKQNLSEQTERLFYSAKICAELTYRLHEGIQKPHQSPTPQKFLLPPRRGPTSFFSVLPPPMKTP